MAENNVCVFCGEKPGAFRSDYVYCGPTTQFSCKACAKEVEALSAEERCRRALRLGLAEHPEKIEEYLAVIAEAESARPACLRCGTALRFGETLTLDCSPMRDGIFSNAFDVIPAYCNQCGKIELYNPAYAAGNKLISFLIKKDTAT